MTKNRCVSFTAFFTNIQHASLSLCGLPPSPLPKLASRNRGDLR